MINDYLYKKIKIELDGEECEVQQEKSAFLFHSNVPLGQA